MGSLGGEVSIKRKAMWLYPKVLGFNPSERWGHSACYSNGVVYVFGGCCGGLHFSDVLMLNLDKMVWSSLVTTGQLPGTRDSHSAVLVGDRMVVLGGTNGSKKVNDLHILDLRTNEWSRPACSGIPPSPRESHSATVVGDDMLVIFGGSGEGEANYLNDVHILDLKTMRWTSPVVKGDLPAPRDSHIAVAVDNKLLVYGGDCGDRYHGEVDVLNLDTMTWSRLAVQGSSPGVRAGHAAINIGLKVFIIGGVGDKHYYNDVWVLDLQTCAWSQLDIGGQQPQGRFSHSAVVSESGIVLYGGCGEDERPLNELLMLQLGAGSPTGRYNASLCKTFAGHWIQEKRRFLRGNHNLPSTMVLVNGEQNCRLQGIESAQKHYTLHNSDAVHPKKRRNSGSKFWEVESEQEEHSLSLSQSSSPSQSDQEQTTAKKLQSATPESIMTSSPFGPFKQRNQVNGHCQANDAVNCQREQISSTVKTGQNFHFGHPKPEQFLRAVQNGRQEVKYQPPDQKGPARPVVPPLMGAEVRGTVDGAFDSGYLMTANVNGQILRGILFSPGPGFVSRAAAPLLHPTMSNPIIVAQPGSSPNQTNPIPGAIRPQQSAAAAAATYVLPESAHPDRQSQPTPNIRSAPLPAKQPSRVGSDLQGVVLTLGHGGT